MKCLFSSLWLWYPMLIFSATLSRDEEMPAPSMALSSMPSQSHLKWHSGAYSASHLITFHSGGWNLKTFVNFNLDKKRSYICKFLRVKMGYTESTLQKDDSTSISLPPIPEQRIVVGCGTVATDFLATVDSFPKPDQKIRSTNLQVQGGGNVGNALTGAARLGLWPRIISKVANDAPGRGILAELEADGVDTSYIVVSEMGNSPFTYVIVDEQTKTRTCIHSAGSPPMIAEDLSAASLSTALTGARIVYFDGRLPDVAHIVAKEEECYLGMLVPVGNTKIEADILYFLPVASQRQLPILVDAERLREGLDELLNVATYVVCSENFPQAWTEAPSVASALVAIALRLPHLKFVIVTRGEEGCIMLEKNMQGSIDGENLDVNIMLKSLENKGKETSSILPISVSSEVGILKAPGIGSISGRLLVGTAEAIPSQELLDTTGAGDGFIGAVLYAIAAGMPPDKMLPFAARVAAAGCRALGARSGLPHRSDVRLTTYLV